MVHPLSGCTMLRACRESLASMSRDLQAVLPPPARSLAKHRAKGAGSPPGMFICAASSLLAAAAYFMQRLAKPALNSLIEAPRVSAYPSDIMKRNVSGTHVPLLSTTPGHRSWRYIPYHSGYQPLVLESYLTAFSCICPALFLSRNKEYPAYFTRHTSHAFLT